MRVCFLGILLWALTPAVCRAAPTAIGIPFDEGRGVVAGSTGGHGGAATLRDGAAWLPGIHGTALGLNGSQYGELDRAAVNTRTGFSVSAWVKVDKLGGSQTFVSQDGRAVSGFALQLRGGNDRFAFTLYDADNPTWLSRTSPPRPASGIT